MISVGKRIGGFTIIEVMIVLASTGALLIIAMTVIGGQVASTNFQTGTRSFATQLQNIANQVTSGQYSVSNINCSTSPAGPVKITISSGANNQGGNGCVFAGKNIYIDKYGSSGSMYVFPVAAPCDNSTLLGNTNCQDSVTSIKDFRMIDNQLNLFTYSMSSGLSIKCINTNKGSCDASNASNQICGLGILATDNTTTNNGSEYDLYKMEGSNTNNQVPPCSLNPPQPGNPPNPCWPDQLCQFHDKGFDVPQKIASATFCIQQSRSNRVLGVTISSNANNLSGSGGNIQGSGFSVNIGLDATC
ncbi:MAG: hypothetical protein WCJ05_01330 [bacterium]